ncbi:MAG: hypothetical protein HOM11_03395 [Methylococcales bacterium]|jgi:poly(3-hydroxybutyrate) depolymerase|nr:hypothetical protein [Methylococcales bacterium]MBT7444839.1 hypothetical protein [Methylococcales bacterium]
MKFHQLAALISLTLPLAAQAADESCTHAQPINATEGNLGDFIIEQSADGKGQIFSGCVAVTNEDSSTQERRYNVYIPQAYSRSTSKKFPMMLGFHGGGGSDNNVKFQDYMELDRVNDLAGDDGFVIIYPNAFEGNWADGRVIDSTREESDSFKQNDLGFVEAIITQLSNHYRMDKQRVYAAGISNGGMMSANLACNPSDKYDLLGISMISSIIHTDIARDCQAAPGLKVSPEFKS